MNKGRIVFVIVAFWGMCLPVSAQISLASGKIGNCEFTLADRRGVATICYDSNDAEVVGIAARMVADDVKGICGRSITVSTSVPRGQKKLIIAGTVDGNAMIRQLVDSGKIDVEDVRGGWEQYAIRLVDRPFTGVEQAIIIAGSDRRGAAYGLLSISEAIGVSPWTWWADVPAPRRKDVRISICDTVSKTPSVKYRGIFINDEDWGLLPWASKTFETEVGSIGPKTYAKVCELLLRLKANYLCPAMHRRSVAFNEIADNKVIADRYAIVMGSVHCEPLLYNNAREWNKTEMGDWNYETNKKRINDVLRKRVEENGRYENIYTLALRGLHDKAMEGSADMNERKRLLETALEDQREILSQTIGKPLKDVPQAFTPYKEVLDIYSRGMNLPDEVTIIWPDDNYGYLKRLSNPAEQLRSGRAGVYYHVSYHGKPHDYLWLCTTPPSLMYEELDKAYRTSADRIWLLNVGDIKCCEYATDLFLRMAYDMESFNYDNIASDNARWLSAIFGTEYYDAFVRITSDYYRLAFSAKPEYMGWGQEWNRILDKQARVTDTDYSFTSYREAQNRLKDYQTIAQEAYSVYNSLPKTYRAAFYELVYYPVKGAELMNRMLLTAQQNRLYAAMKRISANVLAEQATACYDSLDMLTDGYNRLLDGKWNGVVSMKQGVTANYFRRPKTDSVMPAEGPSLGVWADGDRLVFGDIGLHTLPCFNKYLPRTYGFDIFNRGEGLLEWSAESSEEWIRIDCLNGATATEQRVNVSVDWASAPAGERLSGEITVRSKCGTERILVSAFNPLAPSAEELKGLFVEDNGCISIPAADYHGKHETRGIHMRTIENLGYENRSVQLGDPLQQPQNLRDTVAYLQYDFYSFNSGSVDVYTYALPTFPLYERDSFGGEFAGYNPLGNELTYGVSIDDQIVMSPTISSAEYSQAWSENVLRNCSVRKTTMNVPTSGRHSLKILCGDAGVVIQKIVIDFGGMRRSLSGPPSTLSK